MAEPRSVEVMPLDALMGISSDPREIRDAFAAAYVAHADSITQCMRSAGFDWTQEPQPAPTVHGAASAFGAFSSEVVREDSYGVAASLRSQFAGAPPAAVPAGEPRGDTPAGQATLAQLGLCSQAAAEAHPTPLEDLPVEVAEEIRAARLAIDDAAPVRAVWDDWASCMAEQGQHLSDRGALVQQLQAEADEAVGPMVPAVGPPRSADPSIVSAVEDLERHESELAALDLACAGSTDLDRRLREERHELEGAYVAEHGARLERQIGEWRAEHEAVLAGA